ncbi:hypothetical protein PF008_g17149 [Phytophthora fragariae]|uniref:Uncharacterized protein n=1 Tax=Phytophthora fragariae TaxID=53985 RepID=A0A6G0RAG5_9STRA|nr:hypothetical protein PF008_g17149 [Phytophthora fragariae]
MSDGNDLATRFEEIKISQSFQARSPEHSAGQGEVFLEDVLRRNGEEHLYDEILELAVYTEEYPPLIFGWKFVQQFVDAINNANNQAAEGGAAVPPCPFRIPDPLTQESIKEVLLDYARVGTAEPLGTTGLLWTIGEACCAVTKLVYLDHAPWTHHIIRVGGVGSVLRVADLFIPRAGTNILEPAMDPRPNGLWNSL